MLLVFLGIILTIFVEFVLYMVYNLGKRTNKNKNSKNDIDVYKLQQEKLFQQGFYNVVKDYDIDVAMGRREQA